MSHQFSVIFRGDNPSSCATRHRRRLFAQLNLKCGMRVLEIGCGAGEAAFDLARFLDVNVVGVDTDMSKIQEANAKSVEFGLSHRVSFVLVSPDWRNLQKNFGTCCFDGIYALEALKSAPSFDFAYKALSQLLRVGGRLAIYEWCWSRIFDPSNEDHVQLIERIQIATDIGYRLPVNRCINKSKEILEQISVLELVYCEDMSEPSPACLPWYAYIENALLEGEHEELGLWTWISRRSGYKPPPALRGFTSASARVLLEAGQSGLFSPMVMIVAQRQRKDS